jgi:hypothetical protein
MTEEQEKDRGFKVEDRRRFSAEGEVKPEFRDQPDEVEKASPSAGEQGNAALKSGTKTAGEPSEDLAGASQLIDILGMLQQKSRGNLSPEEERLLESILYDLRMRYVALTR